MPRTINDNFRTASHLVTGHFTEGPGYGCWRSQGTHDWLLILTVNGIGRFGYRGGEFLARRGDLIMLTPGSLHDYGVEDTLESWELLWTHFYARAHWHELLNWPALAPGLHHIHLPDAAMADIHPLFLDLHQLNSSALRRREQFAMNQLERLLLAIDLHNPRSEHAQLDPRIRRTMEYVCANLAKKHRMENLAQLSGLSISRLTHLFKQQTGQSPQQFIELQRLNRAKDLLTFTPRTIQTIACDVGFDNPFYFTLRFKKHTGLSPKQYRQQQETSRVQ